MKIQLRDGTVLTYETAQVMGIINVTPDSFFSGSRAAGEEDLRRRVRKMVEEGAAMIDVGACSTRPEAEEVSAEEEMERLASALPIIREELTVFNSKKNSDQQNILLSVDTFRAEIARRCVEEFGADIVNDVMSGERDELMLTTVAELGVPYVLTHSHGKVGAMSEYPDGVTNDVIAFFKEKLSGMDCQEKIILDPGFGFGKNIEQNYQLFANLSAIKRAFPENPLLVGISRKSMIYKLIEGGPEDALNGTSVLNALAVAQGADILRVHDVKEAKEICGTLA